MSNNYHGSALCHRLQCHLVARTQNMKSIVQSDNRFITKLCYLYASLTCSIKCRRCFIKQQNSAVKNRFSVQVSGAAADMNHHYHQSQITPCEQIACLINIKCTQINIIHQAFKIASTEGQILLPVLWRFFASDHHSAAHPSRHTMSRSLKACLK